MTRQWAVQHRRKHKRPGASGPPDLDWSGAVENMPFDVRIKRLEQLADAIEAELKAEPVELLALFSRVAAAHRIARSQVKYGLTFAQHGRGSVVVSASGMVSLTRSAQDDA